jgi:hypothetical protein
MKPPIVIISTGIVIFFLLYAGCAERADEPVPDDVDTVLYRNTSLGFELDGKTEWHLSENIERQNGKTMVFLTLIHDDRKVDLRAVDKEWQGLIPLVRLEQDAIDAQEPVRIGDVQGTRAHLRRFGHDYVRIEKNNVLYELTGTPEGVDFLIEEINWFEPMTTSEETIPVTRVREGDLPDEVRTWFNNIRRLDAMPTADTKEYGDKTYLYVSWGQRPTGGYEVTILEAVRETDEIVVRVRYRRPPPDAMVTQVITYPFDLATVPVTGYPVRFVQAHTESPRSPATLRGTDIMRDVVAESRLIKIFSPAPDTAVSERFYVTGIANVFEATVQYRVRDDEGTVITEGFTTAAAAYDWGFFSFNVDLQDRIRQGEAVTLELYWIDAEDGSERDLVAVPLSVK